MPKIDKSNYLCIGCGGCAYQCPKQCISYETNILGQYIPKVDYAKCVECKICEKYCPIYYDKPQEKNLNFNPLVGNYISSYMGYDVKFRHNSASGGFTTAILSFLLENKIIDYAICLRNSKRDGTFYQYEFIENLDELKSCSSSAYYPMEMSNMLRKIKQIKGKYALVVLPCQAKIIRTIQKKDPILRNRIIYLFGLVCGGMPGKAMIEYVGLCNNISSNHINKISFRDKDKRHTNSNYSLKLCTDRGVIFSRLQTGAFGFAFLNKLFHYRGCNVCDDIFAEYADIVLMDAWLPEFEREIYGNSIAIIRNDNLLKELQEYFDTNPNCRKVSIDVPIQAQNNVGLIQRKKKQAYYKRKIYKYLGFISPDPGHHKLSLFDKFKYTIRAYQEYCIQNKSLHKWSLFKSGKIDFVQLNSSIIKYVKLIKKI